MREGDKNGRWVGKVPYVCPQCGTRMMLTPRQAEKNALKGRTCSRACAANRRRGRKTGTNPAAAKRMRENNPMKRPEVAAKMGATLKESYASGKLDNLREKLREAGRSNITAYNISDKGRARSRQHMIHNNPMRDPEVARKVSDTRKALFASGEWTPPWKGRSRPDATARMTSDRNPMKDPETRRRTLQKIVASHQRNGISQGERNVRDALEILRVNYIQQLMIEGPQTYFLDFFLPDISICIEYDGHSNHYTEQGIAKDKRRDAYLSKIGIKTIRIHRDTAFIGIENLAGVITKRLADEN